VADPTVGADSGQDVAPSSVALVTGAGRGLGRHIATALARAGLAVGLLGRDERTLREVEGELVAAGLPARYAVADVRDFAQVALAVRDLEADLGGFDLLVNNAGVIDPAEVPVWEADPGTWWDVVETDLRGPFHCVRAVVPGMVDRGRGRVIDINSGAGAADRDVYSAYCAAKAGLFRIGGNLHLAGHDRGIRSFELSPGVVVTDMTRSMAAHANRTEWTAPETVTDLVLALARGELDAWSGAYLRAGLDDPDTLRRLAAEGLARRPARTLAILPWGEGDPTRS
jgi:NAD(P)-dependent dehydrogenase (short-subunit alcohol dehydrogenase family)